MLYMLLQIEFPFFTISKLFLRMLITKTCLLIITQPFLLRIFEVRSVISHKFNQFNFWSISSAQCVLKFEEKKTLKIQRFSLGHKTKLSASYILCLVQTAYLLDDGLHNGGSVVSINTSLTVILEFETPLGKIGEGCFHKMLGTLYVFQIFYYLFYLVIYLFQRPYSLISRLASCNQSIDLINSELHHTRRCLARHTHQLRWHAIPRRQLPREWDEHQLAA